MRLPRAAPRRSGPGVPRARPRRRRGRQRSPSRHRGRTADLPRSALGDAGAILDARAKEAYRRRLAEIDEDIEQAQAIGDIERAAQADAERDFLVRELVARGRPGRSRSTSGSASERARASCDPRRPPGDGPDRRAPSRARRAPQPHHSHRYVLRVRPRPSRHCPLAPLTSRHRGRGCLSPTVPHPPDGPCLLGVSPGTIASRPADDRGVA